MNSFICLAASLKVNKRGRQECSFALSRVVKYHNLNNTFLSAVGVAKYRNKKLVDNIYRGTQVRQAYHRKAPLPILVITAILLLHITLLQVAIVLLYITSWGHRCLLGFCLVIRGNSIRLLGRLRKTC